MSSNEGYSNGDVDLLGSTGTESLPPVDQYSEHENLQEVQSGYVDSPFHEGPDELDEVQNQYVGSPFEAEGIDDDKFSPDDVDIDAVQEGYVDSPFIESSEAEDGVFRDEDAPVYTDEFPDTVYEDEIVADTIPKRRVRRFRRKKKDDTAARRRRFRRWVWIWLCCCLLLLLILMIIAFIIGFGEDSSDPNEADDAYDDDENLDDDWTSYKPFDGITTTPMDPFDENDCDFSDNIFPHIKAQCRCYGRIDIVPDDVAALKQEVHSEVNREIYDGEYFPEADSCDPANQALVWLSSGDTRDAGDFFQRYVLGVSHLALNGTNWDLHNQWLAESSECVWIGIQCNSRFQVHNFASDANNLKGKFPTELVKLNGLRALAFSRNHITGTIPSEVFSMRNLEHLHLYANQMRGKIPPEVRNAKKLKTLLVGNNLFFGQLVTELGEVTTLEELDIGFNEFWRKIPTEMGHLTNLKRLVMEENRFSGQLPTEFGRLSHLEYWLLSNNLMNGELPIELANLSHLHEWRFANTGLGGHFPTEFGTAMPNMFRLEMGKNNFEGTIMTEFGLMTDLSWLAMNGNDFNGYIPTEFGLLVNMTRLSLQDTLIKGSIPSELGNMVKLQDLTLDKTNINGNAPDEVCSLRKSNELKLFVTDCEARGNVGVTCDIPECCTFCRRGESGNNSN